MRRALVLVVALTGCGWGNLSNKDLDFYAALPVKEDLESKLPQDSMGSALQQGLNAGDHSPAYEDIKKGVDGFNGLIGVLGGLVDAVRAYPPTKRDGDTLRVWGPFPDKDHPGYEIQVTMEKQEDHSYDFRFEFRNKSKGVDFTPVFTGNFAASEKVGKGHGQVTLLFKAARDAGLPPDPNTVTLDTLTVTYNLDAFPFTVGMDFKLVLGAGVTKANYSYKELADQSGSMTFSMAGIEKTAENPALKAISYTAKWLPSGAGEAIFTIDAVNPGFESVLGQQKRECWDARFTVVFSGSDPGAIPPNPSGDESKCVAVPGL
jgi:hypothetical protein